MCTVTFIKSVEGTILTSNRDEKSHRATIAPESYFLGNKLVIFPKDELAGGTWIALGENGIFCCLLNGAFFLHKTKDNYRKSRGQIVLDLFKSISPESFIDEIELEGIEPFTLIIFNAVKDKLFLLVWDEKEKHISELDPNEGYFWSSATLYSPELSNNRKKRFYSFIENTNAVTKERLYTLHSTSKITGGYILDNQNGIQTVSITQLLLSNKGGSMEYNDLLLNKQTTVIKKWN